MQFFRPKFQTSSKNSIKTRRKKYSQPQTQVLHPSDKTSPGLHRIEALRAVRLCTSRAGHGIFVQNHPMPFFAHLQRLQMSFSSTCILISFGVQTWLPFVFVAATLSLLCSNKSSVVVMRLTSVVWIIGELIHCCSVQIALLPSSLHVHVLQSLWNTSFGVQLTLVSTWSGWP